MQILDLFNKYFFLMMLVACFTVFFIDSKSFKDKGEENLYKKSRRISMIMMIMSSVLFIVSIII